MRLFSTICLYTIAVVILTLSLAMAGSKFPNKDTAKNRQDNTFGTDQDESTATTTFKKDDRGDTVIKSKSRPKPEEVDWYDKIIITVSPDSVGTKTTTTTAQNASGDTTSTTTVKEENKW